MYRLYLDDDDRIANVMKLLYFTFQVVFEIGRVEKRRGRFAKNATWIFVSFIEPSSFVGGEQLKRPRPAAKHNFR